jgi:hypothetical protein
MVMWNKSAVGLEKENTQLILSSKKREEELNDDAVYALLGRVAVLSGKLHESDLVTSLKKLPTDALAKLSVLKIKDIRDVQSRAKETKEIQKATRICKKWLDVCRNHITRYPTNKKKHPPTRKR